MRILFLEQFSDLGGGQRNLLDLLPAVTARGWEAVVAAPRHGSRPGPLFDRARALGAQTFEIPLGAYADGHKTIGDAARFPLDTMRLQRVIARADCDVISAGGARLLMAAALGARGRPVVFQAQHFLFDLRAVRLAGWAIRNARMTVVANSEHVARQFRPFGEVGVVYNGVEEIPFARRKPQGDWRIGIIGRIAPMKGQADFLRAAAHIPRARFIICGAPMFTTRAYAAQVHCLAENLPVEFTGWRDDVQAVLHQLDLLLVPSTAAEATTRVILEAFSAGVPVVAYAAGGIPEVVRDGDNGFLVPECKPEALAARVRHAMQSDLCAIARRARADFERDFTLDRYRRQMLTQYAALLRTHSVANGSKL